MKKTPPLPTGVSVEDRHHEVLFPRLHAEETRRLALPSERARLRATAIHQDQCVARARRDALERLEEDPQAVRRRPIDAPMATRQTAPPLQALAEGWAVIQRPLAFILWSAACFLLGALL